MRTTTLARACSATLLVMTMVACSESPSAPSGPSVDGVWVGTWAETDFRFDLRQSGSSVTGELEVGRQSYALTGEVDDKGEFSWSTEVNQATCSGYSSGGLQLQDGGDAMSGLVRRGRRALPCGSSTRTEVRQAIASMTRAF